MKKIDLKKVLLWVGMLWISFSTIVQAQSYHPYKQRDKIAYRGYQYPLFPGTKAWEDLDYRINKYKLLLLTEDTLSTISTQRLIETCLYYPMMIDVYGFDNMTEGFNIIKQRFNGFVELFNRKDVTHELINYYIKRNPNVIDSFNELYDQGLYSLDFVILELMLSQPEFVSQLDNVQIKTLIKNILNKLESQSLLKQHYSEVFIPISANVLGRLLTQAGVFQNKSNSLYRFIESGKLENPQDLLLIFEKSQIFSNN